MSRREKLEALLLDDPGDLFLRYGLALELEKEGDHEASLARLRELQSHAPPMSRPSSWRPNNSSGSRGLPKPAPSSATASSKPANNPTPTRRAK